MTRTIKKKKRLSKKMAAGTRIARMGGAAAAAVTAIFTSAPQANAELIEYLATLEVTSVYDLVNTSVGDPIQIRAVVETDNLIFDGVDEWQVPFESFQIEIVGSETEIWEGTGGYVGYSLDNKEFRMWWSGYNPYPATYTSVGEFEPDRGSFYLRQHDESSLFTSLHPSGLPMSFDLGPTVERSFYVFQYNSGSGVQFEFSGGLTSVAGSAASPCMVGDANCDGYVDIAGDILPSFSNFTGPGSFGKTRAEGDVQGDATGATTGSGPADGDVDVSDLLTMFGAFTGPAIDEVGLAPAAAADPNIPDLIYDPTTGEVVLDVDGTGIIGYSLKSAGGFLPGGHTAVLGGVATSLATELAEAALSSPSGQNSIGTVFPTGLDLAGVIALLSTNEVSRSLGAPVVPFDVVVLGGSAVPEPSTAALAVTAGLAGLLAVRRRRAKKS